MLGIRPTLAGLRICPCIPREWKGFRVLRRFRGATHDIEVLNPDRQQCGLRELRVDGRLVSGDLVTPTMGRKRIRVKALM
jgi:cellobiose phosphorylase